MKKRTSTIIMIMWMIMLCGITSVFAQESSATASSPASPPASALAPACRAAMAAAAAAKAAETSALAPSSQKSPQPSFAPGRPVHSLSLKDVLQRALSDNPLVRIERINTDIAEIIIKESRQAYEPRLNASYSTRDADSARYQRGSPFKDNHNLSVDVTGDLPTGTNIKVGTSTSPYSSTLFPDGRYQNTIGITVTQALLQGIGTSANLVPLRKARIDADIRREELAAYAQRLVSEVERAYWELLFSGEQMNIYKYSLELAQRLLYETEERLNIGSAAPIDLVAIRAEVASRERQLYDAEVAYRQKALYLIYVMNDPDLWDHDLALADTAASLGKADAIEEHIDAAHTFRPDYRQAFMQAQKGELDLVQTQNGLLPKLDVFATLSGVSPSETFSGALLPNENIARVIAAGVTFTMPVKNGPSRERHLRTQFTVEQQKLAIENYARLLEYEIRTAHMEVERAERQAKTAAEVSELQRQKLEAEQQKMEAGKSTGYAVLQVQRDLVSAHLDEAQARTAQINALITLFSRDGTLLRRRGVDTEIK